MRNIILSVIAAMSAMLAVSCQKGDGEADYGNSLIYIPQATVSAGIDNYYNVPSGGAENTLNFGTTETDVDIYLGVMLSGKKAGSGFSVNIVEDSEASISAAAALGATVLPSSAYELQGTDSRECGVGQEFRHIQSRPPQGVCHGKRRNMCAGSQTCRPVCLQTVLQGDVGGRCH